MTSSRRRASVPLAALVAALALPVASPAPAQTLHDHEERWASDAVGEAAFLGINALVGGLTAGVWRQLSGGSFEEGFAGGALGGSVAYAGKRVAAESFQGAGFLGRDLAAVGSSVVRNAADGRPLLDSLALPAGPLRLHVSPRDPAPPRVEADVAELYWITYGLVDPRLELDAGESLSSGAFVFDAERPLLDHDDEPVLGVAAAGVVFLSPQDGAQRKRSLAHERAHVLQLDFVHHAWFRPLEEHLARNLPADGLVDTIEYDVVARGLSWTAHALGWDDAAAPLESEAKFLEDR